VPKVLALSERMEPLFEDVDTRPIVAVHFMDASGNYWTTGPFMDAERNKSLRPRKRQWLRFRRRKSLAEALAEASKRR
jgi:hypothetical protein